jgi:hypothetical protein
LNLEADNRKKIALFLVNGKIYIWTAGKHGRPVLPFKEGQKSAADFDDELNVTESRFFTLINSNRLLIEKTYEDQYGQKYF